MSCVKPRDCLLLALMLAVSVIAWSGHATVHAKAGADQCLMCASQSDPNSVVQTQVEPARANIEQGTSPDLPGAVKFYTRRVLTRQPRAPPQTS